MAVVRVLFVLLLPWLFGRSLHAQEDLVTDRPDFTESAAVVGPGRVQIEGGYTFTRAGDVDAHALGEILVRIGLGEILELRLAPNSYVWIDGAEELEGLEDPGLGLKWLIAESGASAAALLLGTSVPTGADELGADGWQPEATIALAHDFARASLGANLGWGWEEAGGERLHTALASVALGVPLGARGGAFVEVYGLAAEGAGGEEAYADAGLTRLLSPDFQLDARVGAGLNGAAADWFVGVGAARRW